MMSYNKNIFLTRILATVTTISLFTFSSQAQNIELADDFFKVSATTLEVVQIDAAEQQHILSLMGNQRISCQDDDLSGVFGTSSTSPLAPIVETAKDATEIVDEGNKIIDGLINMGSKIWTIVKAGKPVVNINIGPSANAIPQGVKCWDELEKWEIPSVLRVKSKFENLYGFSLAEFQFDVIYTHGGSFNGKGKYLTHVQVFPSDVYAFWMQEFNASVEIASLFNRGTKADPVAGMQVDVKWQLKNFLNEKQQSASVYVSGDGKAVLINKN
jgi:hypothetical protein